MAGGSTVKAGIPPTGASVTQTNLGYQINTGDSTVTGLFAAAFNSTMSPSIQPAVNRDAVIESPSSLFYNAPSLSLFVTGDQLLSVTKGLNWEFESSWHALVNGSMYCAGDTLALGRLSQV